MTPTVTVSPNASLTPTPTLSPTPDFVQWVAYDECSLTYAGVNISSHLGLTTGDTVGFSAQCFTLFTYITDGYNSSFETGIYPCTFTGNTCISPTPTNSSTPTTTPTNTPTSSVTPSITPTRTVTPTNTNTVTSTTTVTPSNTNSSTPVITPSTTATPGLTPTNTPSNSPTASITPTPTNVPFIPSVTPTTSLTNTPTPSKSMEWVVAALSGNCPPVNYVIGNVSQNSQVGDIVILDYPYLTYTVQRCFTILQIVPSIEPFNQLYASSSNFTGMTQCSENYPCPTPLISQTPTNTTTPTPSITSSLTPTVSPSTRFILTAFIKNCCLPDQTGLTYNDLYYFNVPESYYFADEYKVFYHNSDCYTQLPDPFFQFSGNSSAIYPYVIDSYDNCSECYQLNNLSCIDVTPTPTSSVTPTATPTKTITKTPFPTPTVTNSPTPSTTRKDITPTPTSTPNLIKVQLSGLCSGNIYSAVAQIPVNFGIVGVFSGECAILVK